MIIMQIKRIYRKQEIYHILMLNKLVIQMPNTCDFEYTCIFEMDLFGPYFRTISSITFHFGNYYHKQKV